MSIHHTNGIYLKVVKKFTIMSQQLYHVGNISSYSNIGVEQHFAGIVLGWETAWELMLLPSWIWILMLLRGNRECQ